MSDINQDDIDKLLQDALGGGGDEPAQEKPEAETERGAASQDDIDALFAAAGDAGAEAVPAAAEPPAPAPTPAPQPAAAPQPDPDLEGVANQDDIDALFAAVDGSAGAPAPAPEPAPAPAVPDAGGEDDLEGVANQDDIDALFSSVGGQGQSAEKTEPATESLPKPPAGSDPRAEPDTEAFDDVMNNDDIAALLESVHGGNAPADQAAASETGPTNTEDLDALLSSIADADAAAGGNAPPAHGDKDETVNMGDFDMDALLKEVADAAPPPPPPKPEQPKQPAYGETTVLDMNSADVHQALADAGKREPAAVPAFEPPPSPPVVASPPPALPPPAAAGADQRQEYSILRGAGEVESVANQISVLIATLSEKANRYMQAWASADSEAKELRSRALAEERRRTTLVSEKEALTRELEELRVRVGELEGGKLAWEEARRTLETSFQAKIRELESQVKMLGAETETLKDELTRARNQATGVDIESRRARFEVDRLKNEAESERMERLRIQRALENREKEIQAMQSQSAGQASSLFLDELHRLVRRLESQLESRSAGAHEALKQVDRLDVPEDLVPVVANLRAALMQAIGADDDPDDALKALGREAAGVKGPAALEGGKTEVLSFETAISTYNLSAAIDVAGALLREAKATPSLLMRKVYQCPALRRPEVSEYLGDLARLLEGLRTIQESSDRARGKETGESEVFYVMMFDFLHNLVRLKLLNRLSGDAWRLFLDLRGRFSFVTSDKQWAEYRDGTLNNRNAKA